MTVPDSLAAVVQALERAGLTYGVTGSLASVAWGEPRATYDADVVIQLRMSDVDVVMAAFPSDTWYIDADMIREAIANQGEFNVIEMASGTKVDFWIKTRSRFDLQRFVRRRRADVSGVECWVFSPEDTILAKLVWHRLAPSDRQLNDVRGVLRLQGDALDFEYLNEMADEMGLRETLERVRGDES